MEKRELNPKIKKKLVAKYLHDLKITLPDFKEYFARLKKYFSHDWFVARMARK
jgi:hypothetical protein